MFKNQGSSVDGLRSPLLLALVMTLSGSRPIHEAKGWKSEERQLWKRLVKPGEAMQPSFQ